MTVCNGVRNDNVVLLGTAWLNIGGRGEAASGASVLLEAPIFDHRNEICIAGE